VARRNYHHIFFSFQLHPHTECIVQNCTPTHTAHTHCHSALPECFSPSFSWLPTLRMVFSTFFRRPLSFTSSQAFSILLSLLLHSSTRDRNTCATK
jgi:hypothetical protein